MELRQRDGELPGAIVIGRNVFEWRLDPTGERSATEIERELDEAYARGEQQLNDGLDDNAITTAPDRLRAIPNPRAVGGTSQSRSIISNAVSYGIDASGYATTFSGHQSERSNNDNLILVDSVTQ